MLIALFGINRVGLCCVTQNGGHNSIWLTTIGPMCRMSVKFDNVDGAEQRIYT